MPFACAASHDQQLTVIREGLSQDESHRIASGKLAGLARAPIMNDSPGAADNKRFVYTLCIDYQHSHCIDYLRLIGWSRIVGAGVELDTTATPQSAQEAR